MNKQFINFTYLLYGMGKTNKAVKNFFDEKKIKYFVHIDENDNLFNLDQIDVIIKSPGIIPETKLLIEAKKKNILVINDLELFSWFYNEAKLIIVTGTNGKTSTVRLLSYVLSKKEKCYLGGNIGIPLFSLKSKKNFKNELVIVEASSYMLDNCYTVHPFIYIILNIENHHLAYHQTFDNYFFAKTKLINNMKEEDLLVYPKNDFFINEFKNINTHKMEFAWQISSIGLKIKDNLVLLNDEIIYKINQYPILPKHQLKNIMISSSIGLLLGIKPSKIRKALEDITYEDYRLQKIYEDENTLIINDSKSTKFAASKAALESVLNSDYYLYWIIGGYGPSNILNCQKELDYVDKIYLYGDNKIEIGKDLTSIDFKFELNDNLEEVIEKIANDQSKKIILFSPASQSFDMYENFENRGQHFNMLVNKYWHN